MASGKGKNSENNRKVWIMNKNQILINFLDLSKSSEIKTISSLLRYMVSIWSTFGQGRKLVKKVKIRKVLRMDLPTVENLSGIQESIFSLFRGPPNSILVKKKCSNYINLSIFPYSPCLGSLGLLSFYFPYLSYFSTCASGYFLTCLCRCHLSAQASLEN